MSDLALKLIAENEKNRSRFLDLGNCGLTGIPGELGELVWLEELSFAEETWGYFDGEGFSSQKTKNTGSSNNISSLNSNVSGFSIPNWFRNNTVKSNPFSKLTNLKKLWLNGEYGKQFDFHDLTPLSGLTDLQLLNVSSTQVSDLSHISKLIESGIEVKWSSASWQGNGIYVENCPLTNPLPKSSNRAMQPS